MVAAIQVVVAAAVVAVSAPVVVVVVEARGFVDVVREEQIVAPAAVVVQLLEFPAAAIACPCLWWVCRVLLAPTDWSLDFEVTNEAAVVVVAAVCDVAAIVVEALVAAVVIVAAESAAVDVVAL